jgi:hypothetical protein
MALGLKILSAVLTVESVRQQRQSAKQQKRQIRTQEALEGVRRDKERQNIVRQQLVAQARASNIAAGTGVADSSSAIGQQASIASQAGSRALAIDQAGETASRLAELEERRVGRSTRASIFAGLAGASRDVSSIFSGPKVTTAATS